MTTAIAGHDAVRRYAAELVRDACQQIGLEPPMDGLGVAINQATEAVFGGLYAGTPIGAPSDLLVGTWHQAGWPVAQILDWFLAITRAAVELHNAKED